MPETYLSYRLPDLWRSLAAEDPDAGFTHVNTLNRLRAALEQQRDNLRTHRDRLTESWPPDRSEAAAAFVARINGLLDVMTTTAAATSRITTGVDQTYAALRDARRLLESLMTEFHKHPTAPGLPITVGRPDLDREARQTLITTDATIVKATALIDTPLPEPMLAPADSTETVDPGAPSGGIARLESRTSSGSAQSTLLPAPVFDPPRPALTDAGPTTAGPIGGGTGPVLTGRPGDWTSPAPQPDFSGLIGGGPGTSLSHPTSSQPTAPSVLGPGGVISAPKPPSTSVAPPPSTTAPIGGAVQRAGATPPTARRRAAGSQIIAPDQTRAHRARGASDGYRDPSYEAYRQRRRAGRTEGDQDERWPVREGVPPVIEAPPERPHDPGPGVLGIDR
ncbi:hypothetical protein Dvina_09650 [Dactylosporangium vinaceum]|uniref:Uncharacterized protein n=1 Tax=Dactylosporangium vinaceum TaxID=53362 RepID=A0ABV5MB46_9ACTN|nr:hypothetical protein [Dactylosporangium vinaceum]UAB98322.1 hypothetical protein Dvina_09650 [Dactylosporangium vinaceum]